jgi:hypothetical protein
VLAHEVDEFREVLRALDRDEVLGADDNLRRCVERRRVGKHEIANVRDEFFVVDCGQQQR